MTNSISKASEQIIVRMPFYASLLLSTKIVWDETVGTACISLKEMKISPVYWEKLTLSEQVFLLCHEVLHVALKHHTRCKGKDIKLWNQACDYAINLILVDGGLKMPSGCLLDRKYLQMSAEQIYKMLNSNGSKDEGKGQGQKQGEDVSDGSKWTAGDGFEGSFGDFEEAVFEDQDEEDQYDAKITSQVIQAELAADQRQSDISGGLKRAIKEIKEPTIPWQDQLRIYMSETAKSDYNWSVPNRRYSHVILPSLKNENIGRTVIAIDTSGSMSQDTLDEIAGECNSISDIFDSEKTVVYCDSRVKGVEEFEAGDEIELKFKGGGGTSFAPPLELEYEEEPQLLLYFTDGHSNKFAEEPDYPVLWVVSGRSSYFGDFEPPYGDVIYK